MSRTVLICGAGIAGATVAFWLGQQGVEVTVVERTAGQRSSGNPVDVKGPAVAVAEKMGIMPRLRAVASDVAQMSFVDATGRRVARIGLKAFSGGAGEREVEVPRAELASILLDAGHDGVRIPPG